MDNNARTPIERLRELGEQLWDEGLDAAARIMSECLSQIETELAAANEQRKVAEKESADSEQLRYEENRKVCEWMDRALAAESKLEAARAEQIERDKY